jgi:hypothetical protein
MLLSFCCWSLCCIGQLATSAAASADAVVSRKLQQLKTGDLSLLSIC